MEYSNRKGDCGKMINHFVTALFLMGKWRENRRSTMESGEKPDDLTMLVEHFYSFRCDESCTPSVEHQC